MGIIESMKETLKFDPNITKGLDLMQDKKGLNKYIEYVYGRDNDFVNYNYATFGLIDIRQKISSRIRNKMIKMRSSDENDDLIQDFEYNSMKGPEEIMIRQKTRIPDEDYEMNYNIAKNQKRQPDEDYEVDYSVNYKTRIPDEDYEDIYYDNKQDKNTKRKEFINGIKQYAESKKDKISQKNIIRKIRNDKDER